MSDQVVVVAGGGRGMGEGIADANVDCGAPVVVAARRTKEVERVAAAIDDAGVAHWPSPPT